MKRDRLYFSFLCLCCFLFCALDVQAQQDYWKGQVKDAVSGEGIERRRTCHFLCGL